MPIAMESLNLADAERKLCEEALRTAGSIVEAANLLGITRHALKRRIVKHQIEWPRPRMTNLPRTVDVLRPVPAF
ncbi:helix-turn-helix domain-containing protein [Nannocystaceae bacterium ST9]